MKEKKVSIYNLIRKFKIKRVLMVFLIALLWQSCTTDLSENDSENFEKSAFRNFDNNENLDVEFLSSQREFHQQYLQILDRLRSAQITYCNQMDVSSLIVERGVLIFDTQESFQQPYERVESLDTAFQNLFEEKIEELLQIARSYPNIVRFYENEEEIINGIEELLWSEGMYDHNVQQCISDRMPIQTLWQKTKDLSDEWLANTRDDLDLTLDPANFYVDDEHIQLFLNSDSKINLLGQSHTFREEVEINTTNQSSESNGCRTWKKEVQTGDNGSRKLKVKAKVRNYVVVKKIKAKIVGWKKRRGKWKKRRFTKTLFMGGNVIAHTANLQDNCDPVFAINVSLNKTKKKKKFSISRHWWGPNWYVGACRNQFGAVGSVGSLTVRAIID
jgi:hypothetical protein